ncbi:MotA/TolQ/ExbB proton channel family protein [Rhodohalobacter sp. 8-1]|uniref:MotA/TolQ/ExbB proton channel family protein n=1 Tax=Rhodohalobacter sp. 8-1 TaxID=3131972 RepID=UPI0030EEAF15
MKKYSLILLLTLLMSLTVALNNAHGVTQVVPDTTDTTQVAEGGEENLLESSSMWTLVGQAGNIRYPIFAILVVGLFLISLKVFELYRDNNKSTALMNTPFPDLNLKQMVRTLERQTDHMLSRVMAKLINVFQTNKNADYLHDEISNYSQLQQNNFNSFKNRIDFLSDTAGALGLLGTVWGMFVVFYTGSLEKETILAGMGLALMSTLLGLVVSITLNFASTLTEGYFSKRLEKVTDKADEMRFRLIELSDNPESTDAPPTRTTLNSAGKNLNNNSKASDEIRDKISEADRKNSSKSEKSVIEPKPEPKPENKPDKILQKSAIKDSYPAGEEIKNIDMQLMGTNGEPVADQAVEVVLMHAGKVNGKSGNHSFKTDKNGKFTFNWSLYGKAGTQKAGIRVADKKFHQVRKEISVAVEAAKPENLKILNNHQAVETGKPIKKPIVAVVQDKYENPVKDTEVSMKVTMGNGTFDNGKSKLTQKTNKEGRVETGFTLGDEPGFNAVDIDLGDYNISKKFQAVGQEVTV